MFLIFEVKGLRLCSAYNSIITNYSNKISSSMYKSTLKKIFQLVFQLLSILNPSTSFLCFQQVKN